MRRLLRPGLAIALLVVWPRAALAVSIDQIVALTKAGVSEPIILALIDRDKTVFTIEPEQLVKLQRDGVTETVILAMLKSGRAEGDTQTRADSARNAAMILSSLSSVPEVVLLATIRSGQTPFEVSLRFPRQWICSRCRTVSRTRYRTHQTTGRATGRGALRFRGCRPHRRRPRSVSRIPRPGRCHRRWAQWVSPPCAPLNEISDCRLQIADSRLQIPDRRSQNFQPLNLRSHRDFNLQSRISNRQAPLQSEI